MTKWKEKLFYPIEECWYSKFRYREKDYPLDHYISLDDYKSKLNTFIQLVKNKNVPLLLLNENCLWKENMTQQETSRIWLNRYMAEGRFLKTYPSPTSLSRSLAAYNLATEEIAQQQNVLFLNTEEQIPRNIDFFKDDVHVTNKGAERVAQSVSKFLIGNKVINFESQKK